jgi:oligoendopeptidase F
MSANATYYKELIDLQQVEAFEETLKQLLTTPIESVEALKNWLEEEKQLFFKIYEAIGGHQIDFYRNTEDAETKERFMHDQQVIYPLVMKYEAQLNEKFCSSPFIEQLDEENYGLMRRVRSSKVKLFREENIPLTTREQELSMQYDEIMGSLTVEWNGEEKPLPFITSQLDVLDRDTREKAYRLKVAAYEKVYPEIEKIMDELVQVRHQMAINAGFENYRDYMFVVKNREYSIEDCYDFHENVEKYIIPAWNRLSAIIQQQLNLDEYKIWDNSAKFMKNPPYEDVNVLMDGVSTMLANTDAQFAELFEHMRQNELVDLGDRKGKGQGGFCSLLPVSGETFIFANFSPSFFSLIALIHELGHAVNGYLQVEQNGPSQEYQERSEVAELFSHGMELLLLDQLNTLYTDEEDFKNAQREELRRAFTMLFGPLSGDLFQHWMYTNPNHTAEERNAKYYELNKRYGLNPVDTTGNEDEIGKSWIGTLHFFQVPFYLIEYSMSMLGALQLLENYQTNPAQTIALYKQGARANMNQTIKQIYAETGVEFDFSASTVQRMGQFLEAFVQKFS